jgi:hypothetical protein
MPAIPVQSSVPCLMSKGADQDQMIDVLRLLGAQGAFNRGVQTVAMQPFCGPTSMEENEPCKEATLIRNARLP